MHQRLVEQKEVPFGIIADFSLLEKNDFNFVRTLRKNLLTTGVPIIAIIRENEVADMRKALQAGVDDCYRMPVDNHNLRERIEFLHYNKTHLDDALTDSLDSIDDLRVRMSPLKRAMDIIGSSIVLLCLSPVLLLTALLIRMESRGPIIYRSKRSGTGYQVFDFLKFRSM